MSPSKEKGIVSDIVFRCQFVARRQSVHYYQTIVQKSITTNRDDIGMLVPRASKHLD
jgi:hypothetical protein